MTLHSFLVIPPSTRINLMTQAIYTYSLEMFLYPANFKARNVNFLMEDMYCTAIFLSGLNTVLAYFW
jgi:hypothetical protein